MLSKGEEHTADMGVETIYKIQEIHNIYEALGFLPNSNHVQMHVCTHTHTYNHLCIDKQIYVNAHTNSNLGKLKRGQVFTNLLSIVDNYLLQLIPFRK